MTNRGKPHKDRNWFERILFSFMGPAQLGDSNAPVRESVRPIELCPTCGKPYDDHEVVRTSSLTYTQCPDD